jgi:UDP-N-acetylglucosamine/UDP-N-acetylgalactosamine 4-epimerase
MSTYNQLKRELKAVPRRWLITGVAGFIGSNLLETLLDLDQEVTGLDNFSTGYEKNLEEVRASVGPAKWARFQMIQGDIADLEGCRRACQGAELVLHQAALGSVPRSIASPLDCHQANVTGFLNMLTAARDAGAKAFVYASSSAVYGDAPGLPKVEEQTGLALSPYAVSKAMDELYAGVYSLAYGFDSIGLRYFNVFGPRQDPEGAYAAVIPKWIAALLQREPVYINGDGETTRDFCYIDNVVQANLLAAMARNPEARNQVYNVALGTRITLNELFQQIQSALAAKEPQFQALQPVYREFRAGDVRHSMAHIGKAQRLLGYGPTHSVQDGLNLAMDWYRQNPA